MAEDELQSNGRHELVDDDVSFLTVEQVIFLHSEMIRLYSPGESRQIS